MSKMLNGSRIYCVMGCSRRALSLRHPSERSVIWCALERLWCKNERVASESCPRSVLETANVKLSSVATDVLGKSGRDMLQAIIEGTTDAQVLANLATLVSYARNFPNCKRRWMAACKPISGSCSSTC